MKILSIFSTIPPVALGVSLMVTSAEAFPAYKPTDSRGVPERLVSGGTRSPLGESCISDPQSPQLTSVFPENDLGYTTDRFPAFQWYMPGNSASHVEFNLYEVVSESEAIYQLVYQTAFIPSSAAGIATLQLSPATGLAPLSADTYYYWSVDVYCPDEATAVMTTDGFVEFLEPGSLLAESLAENDGVERAAIAAENSLWFDATRALTEHLQTQPNDPEAMASWVTLLESIGLNNIADAPLLP